METMLTLKERKYIQELLGNSNDMKVAKWPAWAGIALYLLGGFLIVSACFITASNLTVLSIKYVLFPSIVMGLGLIFVGAFIQRISEKSEEQKILVSLVGKLMAQGTPK